MPSEKIKGRIIRILSPKSVVINLGSENGIQNNNLFHILGEPEKVIDPETNHVLGSVKVTKGRVRASQVFDKFSIATTNWTQVRPNYNLIFSGLFGPVQTDVDEGDLKVLPGDVHPWKAKSDLPVRVGDEVETTVEIEEEEEEEDEQLYDKSQPEPQFLPS